MIRILFIAIYFVGTTAFAGMKDCRDFLRHMFSTGVNDPIVAPRKKTMEIDPESIIAQEGEIRRVYRDPVTNEKVITKFPAYRIFPDADTQFGKMVASLERMNTNLYILKNPDPSSNTSGYFNALLDFRVTDPEQLILGGNQLGKGIVLQGGKVDLMDFQVTSMHEGFHAVAQLVKEKGEPSRFNSYLQSPSGKTLLSPTEGYETFMHSEEIHTYTKDFIYQSVVAHNRELLTELKKRAKLFPKSVSEKEAYSKIKITFDSVIDDRGYSNGLKRLDQIVRSHRHNVRSVERELLKMFKGKANPNLEFASTRKGNLILKTKDVHLTLNEVSVDAGIFSKQGAVRNIRHLQTLDRVLLEKVSDIEKLVKNCKQKGYFTGNEYLQLKNEMASLARMVRVELPR